MVWPARPENLFYNDLPNGFAVELSRLLRSHSAGWVSTFTEPITARDCSLIVFVFGFRVFASPLDHEAYRFIPSSYLICTEDNAIPLAAQEEMLADKQGYFLLVERLASGHLPFISRPQETVDFITKTLNLVLTKPAPSQLATSS